jgi:hypothetical protein
METNIGELPPSEKKFSSRATRSTRRTDAHNPATAASMGELRGSPSAKISLLSSFI